MDYQKISNILRALCLISTSQAKSGHPTSCLSAVDIMTVLFGRFLRFDIDNPKNPNNDRVIFSKGHAAPLLYSLFSLAGGLPRGDLLSLRKTKSILEGHPTPRFPYADVATGSLGQGLSAGCGMAIASRRDGLTNKIFVLMGDGEIAEGQVYEACNFASINKLNNLIGIADINGLGQTGKTSHYYDTVWYENVFKSFGLNTRIIDGHNFEEIEKALIEAIDNKTSMPSMILAKTVKGKGISFLENREDFHGKALNKEELEKALVELKIDKDIINENEVLFRLDSSTLSSRVPPESGRGDLNRIASSSSPPVGGSGVLAMTEKKYNLKDEVSTREAFGSALVEVGKLNSEIYILDGDVSNSTYTQEFKNNFPDRFLQCFIAEQNMVGVAMGLSALGKIPICATFSAFLTRAYDQIRMTGISGLNIKFAGSHAGVSIGEDGPSQMGLEDIAMFSLLPDSVILHPCDAVSTKKLTQEMFKHKGLSYLRTLRGKTPIIYNEDEEFKIGGSKILKKSNKDKLAVFGAGITVFEILKAYESLQQENIRVCVIDAYSIKPFDKNTLLECLKNCENRTVITVEDHYVNGGLGDAVLSALSEENIKVIKMGIKKVPCSGDPTSLLQEFGIDTESIASKVKENLKI